MKALTAGIVFLLTTAPGFAEPPLSAAQIVKKEGQFVFSDSGSYYQFKQDGTFESGPLGAAGRTIRGHWTLREPSVFVISGQWGWFSGVNPPHDYRQLTLRIFDTTGEAPPSERPSYGPATAAKIYKCYFLVEELVKIKKEPAKSKKRYSPEPP